jgi:hypothetical protein
MSNPQVLEAPFNYAALEPAKRLAVQNSTQEIRQLIALTTRNMMLIGQRLLEVKSFLPHGQFGTWLRIEFGLSERTAQNWMQVAEAFKYANFADLTIGKSALYLLSRPSMPEDIRDDMLRRGAAGEPITHQRVRQAIKEHRTPKDSAQQQSDDTEESDPVWEILIQMCMLEDLYEDWDSAPNNRANEITRALNDFEDPQDAAICAARWFSAGAKVTQPYLNKKRQGE